MYIYIIHIIYRHRHRTDLAQRQIVRLWPSMAANLVTVSDPAEPPQQCPHTSAPPPTLFPMTCLVQRPSKSEIVLLFIPNPLVQQLLAQISTSNK